MIAIRNPCSGCSGGALLMVAGFVAAGPIGSTADAGINIVNVLPLPSVLSTSSRPPIASTKRLQIVSPNPVPLFASRSGFLNWKNSSKIRSRCSGPIPWPVSRTRR